MKIIQDLLNHVFLFSVWLPRAMKRQNEEEEAATSRLLPQWVAATSMQNHGHNNCVVIRSTEVVL